MRCVLVCDCYAPPSHPLPTLPSPLFPSPPSPPLPSLPSLPLPPLPSLPLPPSPSLPPSLPPNLSTSALYVIDLMRFRQLAAGDRLRGQYQVCCLCLPVSGVAQLNSTASRYTQVAAASCVGRCKLLFTHIPFLPSTLHSVLLS